MRRATTPPDDAHRLAWAREVRFEGRLIHVVVDSCELADGSSVHREIVLHPGAAAILPVLSDSHILLVSQYRRPVDETLWEIPAGKLDPGEAFLACAQRELAEETGYTAGSWQELVTLYTTPGFSNERIALFLARNLVKSSDPEAGEIDRCRSFALDEVARMIAAGELRDAKTILAVEH
ncbi:NUDIX hydrolase, partial [Candidatus Bipolaricaulota bacterium]|nr:NUDIX hydrolase [Candidatus Bipolaricaulota bacterium]